MNWVKRHKLWSLLFFYLGIAILGGSLPFIDSLGFGEMMGICLVPYLFVCFIALKALRK